MALAATSVLGCGVATGAIAADCEPMIAEAEYSGPTSRYPHGVLGDDIEWTVLSVGLSNGGNCPSASTTTARRLPSTLVFEDVAPRVVDLDGDGRPEVLVVESDQDKGARLAIWGMTPEGLDRLAATPFIGTRFRWLAPVGAADLDGDGRIEIAYVDRPHLAKTLRLWRYTAGRMTEVASVRGLSNHRIGETAISGGIRECGGDPEIITASADWASIMATRFHDGRLEPRRIGPHLGSTSFDDAMACRD